MAKRREKPTPAPAPVQPLRSEPLLPRDRMEWVESWGMNARAMSYVFRPSTPEGVAAAFERARRSGKTIALRGAGRSYGDASMNAENVVLDITRLKRILEWNPETGEIKCEAGVTIEQLWQYAIEDGWWPPVVSGTMKPTLAGAAGMNIHGKNNYAVGTIGDHITEFTMMLPNGEVRTCSRTQNPELFHTAIGGFGQLGCFLTISMKLKRVYSGQLDVEAVVADSIRDMIAHFERHAATSDYLVGWVDCFPAKGPLGRGVIHRARYLEPGEDPNPAQSLRVSHQALPDTFAGIVPKSIMWRAIKPLVNDTGMRFVNSMKFLASRLPIVSKPRYRQSHAAFAFLLDYIPNWKWGYKPGGLIQYQSFVPRERAADVFEQQIRLMHDHGIVSYLGVFKKHRPDPFAMTHGLDGYSLALDFPVNERNRAALWKLCHRFDELVVAAGGRLYFAKDSTMRAATPLRYLPERDLERFFAQKELCDPHGILSTNQFRRVFPEESLKQWRAARAQRLRA